MITSAPKYLKDVADAVNAFDTAAQSSSGDAEHEAATELADEWRRLLQTPTTPDEVLHILRTVLALTHNALSAPAAAPRGWTPEQIGRLFSHTNAHHTDTLTLINRLSAHTGLGVTACREWWLSGGHALDALREHAQNRGLIA
ncbi:hypothetical protein ACFY05_31810 [Microtetraspora fusca]|uniref:Uncharacterized protein n=1 Tax=Microtetraspora fusca TaxID=1997 RepID=A0ABW6VDN3_MICFU